MSKNSLILISALFVIQGAFFGDEGKDVQIGEQVLATPEQAEALVASGHAALVPVEPVAVLSRAEKLVADIAATEKAIVAAQRRLEKLVQEQSTVGLLDSIEVGSVVTARIGRAETTREVQGTVVAAKVEASGTRKLKISVGDGFDAEFVVVVDSQVIAIA
jgi:hypothetical protein